MVTQRLVKKKVFPRPHNLFYSFGLWTTSVTKKATIIPFIFNDDGQGAPSSHESNPEHASFVEATGANNFPDSRVNSMMAKVTLNLSKHCWNTDKLEELRVLVAPIFMSFKDDYDAVDDRTSAEAQDIVNMQYETTDRQGYPLYNGVDLSGDQVTMNGAQPGLTTDTTLEGITFDPDLVYNAMKYYTNGPKVSSILGKLRWVTVKRRNSKTVVLRVRLTPKVKRINPYTFCGVLIYLPGLETRYQFHNAADDTSTSHHLDVKVVCRYNEWNDNFNNQKA